MERQTQVPTRRPKSGFTIVEVVVALMVLTIGVVGMASTTLWVVRSVAIADATSKRTAALQSTVERLSGMDFDSLLAGSDSIGRFAVAWTISGTGHSPSRTVTIVTEGPGLTAVAGSLPVMSNSVVDSFVYKIIHP
jgi:prepilin-type N-terminal cleavage/methylation domain-containing protein